jgi:hypothetical protein
LDGHADDSDRAGLIERAAARIAFGRPVLMNTFRAVVAEAIIAQALDHRWAHCAADYHPYDFERDDGVAVEVKQSAARQSWAKDGDKPSRIAFDIAERTGRYVGNVWVSARQRWADIYVFAHHPRTDASTDHRRPEQWDFYVVHSHDLPEQATLSLARLTNIAQPTCFKDLGIVVNHSADGLTTTDSGRKPHQPQLSTSALSAICLM